MDVTLPKITPVDADALNTYADTLEAAQASSLVTYDTRVFKAVSSVREPLRKGRDQVFAALRIFADGDDVT